MPIFTAEGVRVPAGSDPYALTTDLRLMAESIVGIAVAPSAAGRTALLSELASAGRSPSPSHPLYVHQSDTGTTWKNDGSGWRALGVPEVLVPAANPVEGQTFDSKLIRSVQIPAAPYARRLVVNGTIYGSAITGTWDGTLSVDQSQVNGSQRFARFPQGAAAASVSMAYTHDLPANQGSTARLWVRRIGAAGTSLTTSSAEQYTSLDVQAFQL